MQDQTIVRKLEAIYCSNFSRLTEGVYESQNTYTDSLGQYKIVLAILSDQTIVVEKIRTEFVPHLCLN